MNSGLISELRQLVGDDAVLLPIPRGRKGPLIDGWQLFTPEQMNSPEYLARLNDEGNIGVLLGNGRVTIDLDQDKFVEPFLELNPKLRETLQTRRARGCNLWLRIKGQCPGSCKLKTKSGEDFGEWRADGNQTVIHGEAMDPKKGETNPIPYKIHNRAHVIELAFEEIHWPSELVLPWENTKALVTDDLRKLYGKPYYEDDHGNPRTLNECFWAGLFAAENVLLWEPAERAFYTYRPDIGIYKEESIDTVKRLISDRLLEASKQMNCGWLETQRTDYRLNGIRGSFAGHSRTAQCLRGAAAKNPFGQWGVRLRKRRRVAQIFSSFPEPEPFPDRI